MGRQQEHELIVAARRTTSPPPVACQHVPCSNAGQQIVKAIEPLVPFLAQSGASMVAYTGGLAAAQAAGMALRVSCATPVAGPVGGLLGVCFASALAGQASIKTQQYLETRKNPFVDPLKGVRAQDLLVDAVLGVALFKVMGGRFRSMMPSDLAQVGAIARESLPAPGSEYARQVHRVELHRLFRRDGCHHCGTRRGRVIGDHMPPNKYIKEYVQTARRSLLNLPYVRQALAALNISTGPPRQRYYPQCSSCCQKQAAAIRNDKVTLVFHEVLHRGGKSQAWHWAGPLLGLRHYHGNGSSSGGISSTGSRPWRR